MASNFSNLSYSSPDVTADGDGEGEGQCEDGEGEEARDEHGDGRVLLEEGPERRHDGDNRRDVASICLCLH